MTPDLKALCRRIHALYVQILEERNVERSDRARIADALGAGAQGGLNLIDSLPCPAEAYALLCVNEEALHRFVTLIEAGPCLLGDLAGAEGLTTSLLFDDARAAEPSIDQLAPDTPIARVAEALVRNLTVECFEWITNPSFSLSHRLSDVNDALIRHVCGRLCLSFDVFAMGSYGSRDETLASTLDLLVLIPDQEDLGEAELATFVAFLHGLNRYGVTIPINLGHGTAIRSYDHFVRYELEGMGHVERFYLGNARQVWGNETGGRIVTKAAYALPLTPERLRELVRHRKREADAVLPPLRRRHVKHGEGGLAEIEWLVHLHEMRYPTSTSAGESTDFDRRIHNLANARLIHTLERDELMAARAHLMEVRHRLILMGFTHDVIPENPKKLARLAGIFGHADGNDFLAYHEHVIDSVRSLYIEGLERLKA